MKRNLYIIASIFASILCGSCDRAEFEGGQGSGQFTLSVEVPGASAKAYTKGDTRDGVRNLNENLITSVYYYFFPEGAENSASPVSGHFLGLNLNGDESEESTNTWTIPISANTVANELFPSGSKYCRMFVVANPPAEAAGFLEGTGTDAPTLETLRAYQFYTALTGIQSSFVMFCEDQVEVESRTSATAFNAVANMKRVATKTTMTVSAVTAYTDPETKQIWNPLLGNLTVEFHNGMNNANFSGDFGKLEDVDDDFYFESSSSFGTPSDFRYEEVPASDILEEIRSTIVSQPSLPPTPGATSPRYVKVGDKYYALIHSVKSTTPMYSYPMAWEFADQHEPYFLFELPWQTVVNGNTITKPCYYKLMLGIKSLSSNSWYDVSVILKVMGSFYKTAPTQEYLHEQYLVLDWNNAFDPGENNVDAEIDRPRYLMVDQNDYILYNQQKLSIPFYTSNDLELVINEAYHTNYSANSGPTRVDDKTKAKNWFHFSGTVLEFDHPLHNALDGDMDVSPYIINITVRHKDNPDYHETISIIQYPSVYIYTQINSGGRSTELGYTYVNNAQSGGWRVVLGANDSGNNSSIQFTIINVSQFDPESGFIVGDPRQLYVDNLDKNTNTAGVQWNVYDPVNARDLYSNGTRKIENYYPTIDDGTRDNYIAPSFRVNTANCRSGQNETYENAVQRCASYQEDGYPAGRWRLPTLAECRLLTTMAQTSIISQIFIKGSSYYYYFAGGWFTGNALAESDFHPGETITTHSDRGAAARCVYDEWYWSVVDGAPDHNDPDYDKWRPIDHDITSNTAKDSTDPNISRSTFVWGDREIN